MPKIVRFPSLGGKPGGKRAGQSGGRRCLALLIAASLATTAVRADDYADGAAAFAARDYPAAASFWRKAADTGSAEAQLQLGLMADLGLGTPRDPAAAFAYYFVAAKLGLPDAAFNVGVMLDAGTDVSQDRVAAGVWYARAALGGNKRAALNLGLLYEDGSGVPANDDLAAYWFGQAVDKLPAAKAALQQLKSKARKSSDKGKLTAPMPLSADRLALQGSPRADLVWTAKPGAEGAMFVVQVLSGGSVWTAETAASAVQIPVSGDGALWRVARIDPVGGRYKASAWQHQLGSTDALEPAGLVSFVVNPGDTRADALARQLAQGLQQSGLAVSVDVAKAPADTSAIQYRYIEDAGLAGQLAALLPGFAPGTVTKLADLKSGPGEIVVHLVLTPPQPVSP